MQTKLLVCRSMRQQQSGLHGVCTCDDTFYKQQAGIAALAGQPQSHVGAAAALCAVQVVVNTPSRSYSVAQLQQLMTDIGDQQAVSIPFQRV
jgi:hypothetical protein